MLEETLRGSIINGYLFIESHSTLTDSYNSIQNSKLFCDFELRKLNTKMQMQLMMILKQIELNNTFNWKRLLIWTQSEVVEAMVLKHKQGCGDLKRHYTEVEATT